MRDAAMTALMLVGQQVQMAGFRPADTAPRAAAPVPALFGCFAARPLGDDNAPVCESLASRSAGIVVRSVGDALSTWPDAAGQATDCLGQGAGAVGAPASTL